ncbi:monovalent cation/H+ antiporter subunit D family protein [Nocardia uniformis]|uniref:Monovalent cation/H+ antiporter subunit D family protein n=1 Tax=Nocardia uniformis TaxID=53432 RepID=A0A849CBT5_9NOCA|nr:proton-conducting transporter membrane subunit [Nocardia uniformis]NNH75178.1 monovalent cation/H+ antiporter subunit D family protein [Nocardia uniformis]
MSWTGPGQAFALPVLVLLPLIGAAAVAALRGRPNPREAASLVTGVALAVLTLSLWPRVDDHMEFRLWDWLPGLTLGFEVEPLGLLFASVAAVLWPLTTVFSIGYMRSTNQPHQTRFYAFFAIAIGATMWIALSDNLITLFIGYEALTLATWPLVAHQGGLVSRRGVRVYLALLLTTSIGLLLPAIIWTWQLAGTTDFRAGGLLAGQAGPVTLTVLFALYLFGIGKAALMPFHRWLPAAMVAPTPVSALLHAVAVVKAGGFAVLKVAIYVFGLDTLTAGGIAKPMMWVAAFTLITAGVIALRSDNLKRRLAYSTVSQLAYIVLAATLATDLALAGGSLHLVTHAFGKITLFFCAGAIFVATGRNSVSDLDGLGRMMPWTFGAFTVAALSIVGLPPTGGMWSKWLLLLGAADAQQRVMIGVLAVGTLLALGYLMPIVVRGFFRTPAQPVAHGAAPWTVVAPPVLTAAGCVALFFTAPLLVDRLGMLT